MQNADVITLARFPSLVTYLRAFIGVPALKAATQRYLSRENVGDKVSIFRLRANQPLIEAFLIYDKRTMRGSRRIKKIDRSMAFLAKIAMLAEVISPTLQDSIKRHHIGFLLNLDGGLSPLVVEWQMAHFYISRYGARIKWIEGRGPEFVATAEGLTWEVECKRLTPNISELLRERQADDLASTVSAEIDKVGLCGKFTLEVGNGLSKEEIYSSIDILKTEIQKHAVEGRIEILLSAHLSLSGDARAKTGRPLSDYDTRRLVMADDDLGARRYIFSPLNFGRVFDPIILEVKGEKRDGEALLEYLWKERFECAALQCSRTCGAVLVFEWSGIESNDVFDTSEGLKALATRTFLEHKHVASIIMRAAPRIIERGGFIGDQTPAYFFRSEVTDFPEIAALKMVDHEFR